MTYKAYVELPFDDIKLISDGIYKFIETETDILSTNIFGWHFIDLKALLASTPILLKFFKKYKLIPRHAAVTIITDDSHLPKHIDELPVIAKINIPVCNTAGWANRWYENDQLIAELLDMSQPIVFNSQIEHSVEKTTANIFPRIIASFTFHNEPLDLLK
jgi:hypothetical protein